jgi:hypothetical protein
LDLDGCTSQVGLRVVDLRPQEVKPGLMVITVDGNGLDNIFLPISRWNTVAYWKFVQFSFRHYERCRTTIHTNDELWEYPDAGLVNIIKPRTTDAHLSNILIFVD